jgi:hypothetical protein
VRMGTDHLNADAVIDLLIERKETVLAATGWEGYIAAGRGALMTDAKTVVYLNRPAIKYRFPGSSADRKRLLCAVDHYDPTTEIVALVCWADGSVTIRRHTPRLPPEAALLERAGTAGMPPMTPALAGVWSPSGLALWHQP